MAPFNAGSGFPVVTSLAGSVLFATGKASAPLSIPVSGSFALAGYNNSAASNARLAALREFGYIAAIRDSMRRVWYSRWFDAVAAAAAGVAP